MTDTNTGDAGAGDGGGSQVDFLTTLPADLRGDGTLKGFAGADGHHKLARSYTELVRAHSGRKMADMDAPTDSAAIRAVMVKLGAESPEQPEGYNLPDTTQGKQFRGWAHQHGLSTKQAEGLFNSINNDIRVGGDVRKTAREAFAAASAATLRQEWGENFDANTAIAQRGYEHFVPEAKRENYKGLMQDSDFVKMFNSMGRALQEGTMFTGAGGPSGGANTQVGLKAERLKIEAEMNEMRKQDKFDPAGTQFQDALRRRQVVLTKEGKAFQAGITP